MADSEAQSDTTQQVTSNTPATKQKNPKRIAAGKAIADKTRQAREAQKKALAEAQVIIENQKLQKKVDRQRLTRQWLILQRLTLHQPKTF